MKTDEKVNLLDNILSEEEFLTFVQEKAKNLLNQCLVTQEEDPEHKIFNTKFLCLLIANAKILEDFLDDHGAKRNQRWFYFRELVATIKGFAETGYLVAFITKRYPPGIIKTKDFDDFYTKLIDIQNFIAATLVYIFNKLTTYAKSLGVKPPKNLPGLPEERDLAHHKQLPVTMGKPELEEDGKDIAKICSLYQNFEKNFESTSCLKQNMKLESIMQFIPEVINEEKIRKFELEMHNLESVYDTYVNCKFKEDKDPRLADLRNYISIPLILLEASCGWSHFYERHPKIYFELLNEIKTECALKCITNWALYYCKKFVSSGKILAEEIMRDYTAEGSVELNIPQKMGFHLRPATLVAKVVNYYGSKVDLIVGEDKFDASSPLSIIWAGGKIARENIIKVTFVGDKRALRDLEILASVNYGEDFMGKDRPLPESLSYLR